MNLTLSLSLSRTLAGIIHENYLRGRKRALWYVIVIKILTHKKSLHVCMIITCLLSSVGHTDRPATASQLTESLLVYIIVIVISMDGLALKTKSCSCWSPWTLVLCCGTILDRDKFYHFLCKKLQTTEYRLVV